MAVATVGGILAIDAQSGDAEAGTPTRQPRVLLVGDSILDQEGMHAAFQLRQLGIDATAIGSWGSSLLTREQYDMGATIATAPAAPKATHWLSLAPQLVKEHDPDVVAIALNHNYAPPYPRDANGNEIADLRSPAGRRMIESQLRAFIELLRAGGAEIVFITPVTDTADPDPLAWNAIWSAYQPVIAQGGYDVIDIAPALVGADGRRAETAADCAGAQRALRQPNDNVHLVRFGAGRAGSILADALATKVGVTTLGNAAPGEATVTLVPTPRGAGYWLVACDGSVYHFGEARPLARVRTDSPIVGAAPSGDGGLWLVSADGRIFGTGATSEVSFTESTADPLVAVTGTARRDGVIAVTARGRTIVAGNATDHGDVDVAASEVVGIAMHPSGNGYWLATADGAVFGFGAAATHGSTRDAGVTTPVVGIVASPTGAGYRLALTDGAVVSFGDASPALVGPPPGPDPGRAMFMTPEQSHPIGIAAAGNGFWVVLDNGEAHAHEGAVDEGGTGRLALFTL